MPILLKNNNKKYQPYNCCRRTNKIPEYDRTLNLFALFHVCLTSIPAPHTSLLPGAAADGRSCPRGPGFAPVTR